MSQNMKDDASWKEEAAGLRKQADALMQRALEVEVKGKGLPTGFTIWDGDVYPVPYYGGNWQIMPVASKKGGFLASFAALWGCDDYGLPGHDAPFYASQEEAEAALAASE